MKSSFDKIIYLSPVTYLSEHIAVTPTHLVKLCSFIDKNFSIEQVILDAQMEFGIPLNEEGQQIITDLIIERLGGLISDSTIFGISLTSAQDVICSLELLKKIKKSYNIPIIAGGYGVSLSYELIITQYPELFDCIIVGPGEFPLLNLLKASKKGKLNPNGIEGCAYFLNKKLHFTKSNFEIPTKLKLDWSFLKNKKRYQCLATSYSQHCSKKCNFCIEPSMNSKIMKSDLTIYELNLRNSLEQFNQIENIWLTDPHFGLNQKIANRLISIIGDNKVKAFANLRCDFDMRRVSAKDKLKNWVLYFGLESANEITLQKMNKTKNPKKYLELFYNNINLCSKLDILPMVGLIVNYPYEKLQNTKKTIFELRKKIDFNSFGNVGLIFSASLFMIHYNDFFYKKLSSLKKDGLAFYPPFFNLDKKLNNLQLITKKSSKDVGFKMSELLIEEIQNMSVIKNNTIPILKSFGFFDKQSTKLPGNILNIVPQV